MTEIIKWLRNQGSTPDNRPLFRIVFSDEQFEWRHGTFQQFKGSLYLRTITGEQLVPKYSYINSRWILEMWVPPEKCFTPEIPETRSGSYEPLFVFEDSKYKPLPITMKAVQFIVNFTLYESRVRSSESGPVKRQESEANEIRELNEIMDSFDCSEISNALHLKEGIGYRGNSASK